MKLLWLKITDTDGFRSLPTGFEHHFRTEISSEDEVDEFAPFVCAGRNGSGKSNLLEALAAIFYQLEVQRKRGSFLPEALSELKEVGAPRAFELEYLIYLPLNSLQESERFAHVRVIKELNASPNIFWLNSHEFRIRGEGVSPDLPCGMEQRDLLLPEYVLGYSSGENEILSLPFFKMRQVQFDEYWTCLSEGLPFPQPYRTRLTYLDSSHSQAILICNLLFVEERHEAIYARDIGLEQLREFRIVLKRKVLLPEVQARPFIQPIERSKFKTEEEFRAYRAPEFDEESGLYKIDVLRLLEFEGLEEGAGRKYSQKSLEALRLCATLEFYDEATDTLVLDYWVNKATQDAFRESFSDARTLFQAFQVLLSLNLYTMSDRLKSDMYRSDSHYAGDAVPKLAPDERVVRFSSVRFSKEGVEDSLVLKSLSDGEHQLLHSLGLCLLFRDTNSLFLLDEPETHFNPDWRASLITRLLQALAGGRAGVSQEMLITTHSPFLISDSKPEKVLVFEKDRASGKVTIKHPEYNTLGASINKITMNTFGKRETIGGVAEELIEGFKQRFEAGDEDLSKLVDEIEVELGDSVEKILLIKAIQNKLQAQQRGG